MNTIIDLTSKHELENIFAKNFNTNYFPVLADIYFNEGDLRRARLVCETGLKYNEHNHYGKFILGKIAIKEKNFAIAEKWLTEAINENPANFNALRLLIKTKLLLKRSNNVINKYINQILFVNPEDKECLNWLQILSISYKEKDIKPTNTKHNAFESSKIKNKPITKEKIPPKSQDLDVHENINIINKKTIKLKPSMATFTMLKIFKSQNYYHKALEVLSILKSQNPTDKRIELEKSEIESLIKREKKN